MDTGAPKTNRTSDLPLRRGLLYPLSYRGAQTGSVKENGRVQTRPFLLRGGAEGDRTLDLRIANATLSQLSYRPTRGRAL